ncbi:MAG: amino acid racemase [Bacteroidales bacterium]|nr:amino acid racemase [Bacteroidales bacterium]MBN2758843.1 amino acid racemase [Bacteroidales bacterium]
MKTLGLIGGTGWASSAEYYRIINELTNKQLGGLNYSRCILYSFNYEDVNRNNLNKDYNKVYEIVEDAVLKLISIGAEGIVLCANTLHDYAEKLQTKINVPIIHIAEATALQIIDNKIDTIGLLGTKQTMEKDFYKNKLSEKGIRTLIPNDEDRDFINNTIFTELFNKEFKTSTRRRFVEIMGKLRLKGAKGIILGCTEIPLLIQQKDFDLPLFDTLQIHAEYAVKFALS